jgi:hypothetical protein
LRRLYEGRGSIVRWADLFAAIAPDEDVVETYKLVALKDAAGPNGARLASLTVAFTGSGAWSGDIMVNLTKQKLCTKVQFIKTSLLQPPPPC